ncbi:DUF5337 domain-containing protein [Pontibaca methylaminivorans]|uniref:DUF5337 domain-containing protein n=1 Tax=Pontibaca methylaminivorans TaxID=515897 RepID=UPI002FD91554
MGARNEDDMTGESDIGISRRGRVIAVVIALSGLAAILAPVLAQLLALPVRYEMLFYFGAIGGFVWALINSYQLWRLRRKHGESSHAER